MNWLPIFSDRGNTSTRKSRFSASVVLRYRRQSRRIGRYRACVNLETGFRDSGRSLPLMSMSISIGTSVIARRDEKPTASVLVQASGRNMRPSCASSKKTGRNETTIISNEKKQRRPNLLGSVYQNLAALCLIHGTGILPFSEMAIPVLDHHNGRVHQNANGKSQTARAT